MGCEFNGMKKMVKRVYVKTDFGATRNTNKNIKK